MSPLVVSDGFVFRVLQNLLVLDGERLATAASTWSRSAPFTRTIMGFRLEKAEGRSHRHQGATKAHREAAPVTINLEE